MPAAGVGEDRDALFGVRCGQGALRLVARAGEDLRVHERLAVGAQLLEGRGVAAALGQAVAAVAEGVRAGSEPRIAAVAAARASVGGADRGDVGEVHALAGVEFDDERGAGAQLVIDDMQAIARALDAKPTRR